MPPPKLQPAPKQDERILLGASILSTAKPVAQPAVKAPLRVPDLPPKLPAIEYPDPGDKHGGFSSNIIKELTEAVEDMQDAIRVFGAMIIGTYNPSPLASGPTKLLEDEASMEASTPVKAKPLASMENKMSVINPTRKLMYTHHCVGVRQQRPIDNKTNAVEALGDMHALHPVEHQKADQSRCASLTAPKRVLLPDRGTTGRKKAPEEKKHSGSAEWEFVDKADEKGKPDAEKKLGDTQNPNGTDSSGAPLTQTPSLNLDEPMHPDQTEDGWELLFTPEDWELLEHPAIPTAWEEIEAFITDWDDYGSDAREVLVRSYFAGAAWKADLDEVEGLLGLTQFRIPWPSEKVRARMLKQKAGHVIGEVIGTCGVMLVDGAWVFKGEERV